MEDTGLCPRAISKAIARLDKHHLILRVAKYGALPNRYRISLESAAPQKIPKAKKPARASKRPTPAKSLMFAGCGRVTRRPQVDVAELVVCPVTNP
jgi:hypothetical protein